MIRLGCCSSPRSPFDTDRNKTLLVEEYLNKTSPYLKGIINNFKKSQIIPYNLITSIDNDEQHVMHSKSDNIEIVIINETDKIIAKLFDSIKNRYQNNLESMSRSEFAFNYFHLLYYKCHKTNANRGGSYKGRLNWIKKERATINFINKKDSIRCQYFVTVAFES